MMRARRRTHQRGRPPRADARARKQELHGRSELINRLLNRALVKQCPPELERLLSKPNLPRAFGAAPLPRRRAGPPPCPEAREACR
jgi:hypothetical protein